MSAGGLGFSVEALLPRARGGGPLRMGLVRVPEGEWLDPAPDRALRATTLAAHPEAVQLTPAAHAPGAEVAALLGVAGGLAEAAQSVWEDLCVLTRAEGEAVWRLAGAAVAFPTDWHVAEKLGLPLAAVHAPIPFYAEQLASGVDHFMDALKPGPIFGRCNWDIAPTPALRWLADVPPEVAFAHVTPANAGEALFVRCERQTLRKLPETGAVLFTIGVYLSPLGRLAPGQRAWLVDALAALPAPEAARRGTAHYAPQLAAFARDTA